MSIFLALKLLLFILRLILHLRRHRIIIAVAAILLAGAAILFLCLALFFALDLELFIWGSFLHLLFQFWSLELRDRRRRHCCSLDAHAIWATHSFFDDFADLLILFGFDCGDVYAVVKPLKDVYAEIVQIIESIQILSLSPIFKCILFVLFDLVFIY